MSRKTLPLLLWALVFVSACSEPRCPRNLVQDGRTCRRCPEGAHVEHNLCVFADASVGSEGGAEDDGMLGDDGDEPDVSEAGTMGGALVTDGGSTADTPVADGGRDLSVDGAVDSGPGPASGACDASAACCDAGQGSCGCGLGQKQCRSTCIAETQCCEDQECASGARCVGGSCKYWCDEQMRPVDVLPTDYQCLDFERGLPSAATWVRSTNDTVMLASSNERALSLPMSLRTSGDVGLTWTATGSARVSSFSFSAAVSPVQHSTVLPEPLVAQLICLSIGDLATSGSVLQQCLNYTYKGNVDGIENYTGLYISTLIVAGAELTQEAALYDSASPTTPLNLNTNVWNTVSIRIESGIQVTVNGKTATVSGGTGQDTKAIVSFGASNWTVSYDNVVVSLRR